MSVTLDSRVPAEYRGLARAFIGKVRIAHLTHNDFVNLLVSQIEQRHKKHPDRSMPATLLTDISNRWKHSNDGYRIAFANKLKNNKGTISEGRVGSQGLVFSTWEKTEPNLVICFVSLSVTRSQAQVTVKVAHSFSAHSIARFYQRTGLRADKDVIGAMIGALTIEPKDHAIGADVHVSSWRGTIKCRDVGKDRLLMWCARTWL